LSKVELSQLEAMLHDAILKLGLKNAVVKGDLVYSEGQFYIIELALRLSGGFFCSHEIPLNTGVDFIGAAVRLALGQKVEAKELQPKFNKPVVQRYLFAKPCVLESIEGWDQAKSVEGIEFTSAMLHKGQELSSPTHAGAASAAVVIATGKTKQQATQSAERAIELLHIISS